jgi:hypothetical protein
MSFAPFAPPPTEPVEISNEALQQLRTAASWSRFLAVFGFVLSGLIVVGAVAAIIGLVRTASAAERGGLVGALLAIALFVILVLSTSALLWGYAQNVRAFFRQGEPALARAFRSLRFYLQLGAVLLALSVAFTVIVTVGILLR